MRRLRGLAGWGLIYWRYRIMSRAAPRLANARDIAGGVTGLLPAVVYRADAPRAGDVSPADCLAWPPATVVDLRAAGERTGDHPLGEHARVVHIDVLDAAALGGGGRLNSLAELYSLMIAPQAASGLVRVVAAAARDEPPVLIHCSAGKDRTGVSVALILRLLGVDRHLVVADYVRTEKHMPGVLARLLSDRRKSPGRSPLAAVPHEILEAPASAIETVLDVWDDFEGGVEGWYLAHGGDRGTLDELRSRLRQ